MLENKNLNIVLAIIIAVCLWAYVLGDVNPTTDLTVKDVPISFTNEEALANSGLVVLKTSDATINVTISGPRTEVTKVERGDFKVIADLEALSFGDNVVRLSVKGPDNIKITSISTDKITINVDELVTVSKDIEISAIGEIDGDMEPFVVDISKDTVDVTGAKTLVDKVNRVNAVIDATQIGNSMKTMAATLEAVDAEGNVVEGVILRDNTVNVSVVMHHKKTVPIEVSIVNKDTSDFERSINVPKTIVIKGEDEILSKIKSIKCEEIDLGDYTETTKIPLKPIIPDGIQISADSTNLYAEITVKEFSKATVRVGSSNIKLVGSSTELNYEVVVDDMTIEAQGKEAELIGLDINSFDITADVKGLTKGTHMVKVKVECKRNLAAINLSNEEIKVIIK